MASGIAGFSHQKQDHNVINDHQVIVNGREIVGVDAEAFRKVELKRNRPLEREIAKWVAEVTNQVVDLDDPIESLRSGITLIHLVNAIRPNTVTRYNKRSIPLLEMENIGLYLKGCWTIGVPSEEYVAVTNEGLFCAVETVLRGQSESLAQPSMFQIKTSIGVAKEST
eukprot:TRINITY_DN22071_c0_g1_i1.p2 TRINITY_DN22071_c0_g1~~TRINITY_DN22071_c0_g1_i1.p2  ORF type:complete len:168 (+),score=22.11 TRINITY_DN22071_c0_g1_i1:1125-1628(+)